MTRTTRRRLTTSYRRFRDSIARLRGVQREVENAIAVPDMPRSRTQPGAVWAISVVRNEADVIVPVIEHLLAQGVAGIVVADNGSTDGTKELLMSMDHPRVHVGTDQLSRHLQGRKMSYLAHLAWRAGADWIIPFDADEFWTAPEGTLGEWLPRREAVVVRCQIRNVYPVDATRPLKLRDGERSFIDREPTEFVKVAFRAAPWAWIREGNHEVAIAGVRADGLSLLHVQYRCFDQMSRKVSQGAAAVEAANLDAEVAVHWKELARLDEAALRQKWQDYCGERPSRAQFTWGTSSDDPVAG